MCLSQQQQPGLYLLRAPVQRVCTTLNGLKDVFKYRVEPLRVSEQVGRKKLRRAVLRLEDKGSGNVWLVAAGQEFCGLRVRG